MHLADFPLHPFFECFWHPMVLTFSSTAERISEILISSGVLFKVYPPFFPLILLTISFFFNFKNNCYRKTNDIPCLIEISLSEIGSLFLNLAMSAKAITAYLLLVDSFIFSAIHGLYIYLTKLVKIENI